MRRRSHLKVIQGGRRSPPSLIKQPDPFIGFDPWKVGGLFVLPLVMNTLITLGLIWGFRK